MENSLIVFLRKEEFQHRGHGRLGYQVAGLQSARHHHRRAFHVLKCENGEKVKEITTCNVNKDYHLSQSKKSEHLLGRTDGLHREVGPRHTRCSRHQQVLLLLLLLLGGGRWCWDGSGGVVEDDAVQKLGGQDLRGVRRLRAKTAANEVK